MKTRLLCLCLTWAFTTAASLSALAADLTHGPMIFKVRARTGVVWLRTDVVATVNVDYSDDQTFATYSVANTVTTRVGRDFTAKVLLRSLSPETTYFYRVIIDGVLQPGVWRFRTAPRSKKHVGFKFAVLADSTKNHPAPILDTAVAMDPEFICFVGDLGHNRLLDLETMRTQRKQMRSDAKPFGADIRRLFIDNQPFRQIPFYYVWDDHDYGINNGDRTFAARTQALKSYKEYFVPTSPTDADGIWQRHRFGADTEIYLLDVRSLRDPNNTPDGPDKTMLGTKQKNWLKETLLHSNARWKLLLSGVPFNPGTKPKDAWGGFAHERAELVQFIASNGITGVVILSADIHTGGAMDDGTNSDIPEVSIPHTNMTRLVDTYLIGQPAPGVWTTDLLPGLNDPGLVLCEVTQDYIDLTVRDLNGDVKRGENATLLRMLIGTPPPNPGEIGILLSD